jgi:hypothetical protein
MYYGPLRIWSLKGKPHSYWPTMHRDNESTAVRNWGTRATISASFCIERGKSSARALLLVTPYL